MPCQKSAVFSVRGAFVVIIRYSQLSPLPHGPIMPDCSWWNRRAM